MAAIPAPPHRLSWLPRCLAVALSLFACGPAEAQVAADPALKAAFLYNFARFVNWPAEVLPSTGPLRICSVDAAVAGALEQIAAGQIVDRHVVVVSRVTPAQSLRACHVLYAGGLDANDTTAILDALGHAPVFSIGDDDAFTAAGGIARFFVDGGRLRFAINLASARRADLRINPQLLRLGAISMEIRRAGLD